MFDPYAHLDLAGRWRPSAHPVCFENPNSLRFFLSPYVNTASPYTSPKSTDGFNLVRLLETTLRPVATHTDRFESCPYWSSMIVGVIKSLYTCFRLYILLF